MKTKLTVKEFNRLLGVEESYQAPDHLMKVLKSKTEREEIFRNFLDAFKGDINEDWFTQYFQEVQADRKNLKQDFTPPSVSNLLANLVGNSTEDNGINYDICAGSGGLTIAKWHSDRIQHSPFNYKPNWYMYVCEELSEASIPFLLFNLAIRGMNAVVICCDVISRKSTGAFFIQNDNDDHMQFSNIYRLPYNDTVAKELSVTWIEEKYDEYDKVGDFPKHLGGNEFLELVKTNA